VFGPLRLRRLGAEAGPRPCASSSLLTRYEVRDERQNVRVPRQALLPARSGSARYQEASHTSTPVKAADTPIGTIIVDRLVGLSTSLAVAPNGEAGNDTSDR